MSGLVLGQRAGQRKAPGFGPRITAAGKVEIDKVRTAEARVSLDYEHGMAADDDRQIDPSQAGDRGRPEAGRVDDDRRVDPLAGRGRDPGDAVASGEDRHDLHALFDHDAVAARAFRVRHRDCGRIAITRLGLVQHGPEIFGIDPRLDAREVRRLKHVSAHSERPLPHHGLLELGTHGGRDADQDAAADVARLAADHVAEAAEDLKRSHDHLRGLGGRVELADDADRPAGAAGCQEPALEEEDVANPEAAQVKGDRDARDAAPDDDDRGVSGHFEAALTSARARPRARGCPGRRRARRPLRS